MQLDRLEENQKKQYQETQQKQSQEVQQRAARQIVEIGVNTSPKSTIKPGPAEYQKQSIEIKDESVDKSSDLTHKK